MFNNLQEYYIYLDSDTSYKEVFGLSSNLKPLLNNLKIEEEKEKCTFEICFQDFHFRNGEYIPLFSSGENCYPALEQFNDLDYLKIRTQKCSNHKYKAKYYHLLYQKQMIKETPLRQLIVILNF